MTQDPELGRFDEGLERRVDRALKQLPAPIAPPQFAARVMQRVNSEATGAAAHARPEAPRAVFEWPLGLKVAVTGGGFLVVAVALLMWPAALETARTAWHAPSVVFVRAAVSAARPMVPAALVYMTAMCAVAAAAVSMLKHVALGGATIHENS
jgi:hypothetical protein